MKVARREDIEVLLELGDHEREHVAGLVVGEEFAQFLGAAQLVLALDDRAFVDADANRDAAFLAGVDHLVDLVAVADVAGVEANLVHARFDGLEGTLEVEVHIGHDRNRDLLHDLDQRLGVLALRHRHSHYVDARRGVALDFLYARIDVVRVARRHGLYGNWCVAADSNSANAVITNGHLTGFSTGIHRSRV